MTHPKNQERCLHTEDLSPTEEQSNNRVKTMNQRLLTVKYTVELTQEIAWGIGEGENELTISNLSCNLDGDEAECNGIPVILSVKENGKEITLPGVIKTGSPHDLIQKGYQELIAKNPLDALGCASGVLVGVVESVIEAKGEDPYNEIN